MKILIAYGTRPEYIKIKPLIEELKGKIEYKILFTGQHVDIAGDEYDFKTTIQDGINRLDSIVQSNLNLPDQVFEGITHILIQGDTTSAFSLALAAFHRKIKIIHLEAGLRTDDIYAPYPEEANRQMIARITDIHFCPTVYNAKNLSNENVRGKCYIVGNTGLDNLRNLKPYYGNEVLVTLHRRENHEMIADYFKVISELASENKDLEFILPIHPNPNVRKHKDILKGVKIIEPLKYEEMLKYLERCKIIISDSGGIQEEASFLNKKVIVCRVDTERPESVETHSFLCPSPVELKSKFNFHNKNYIVNAPCPYGDGKASEKIANILLGLNYDSTYRII